MKSMVLRVPDAAEIAERFGAAGAIIYGIEGQDLSIIDIWPPHPLAASLHLRVGFGVTGQVARTRRPLLLEEDSPRNAVHRELLHLEPHQTVARMCLPLPGLPGLPGDGEPEIVGVLAVHRVPRRPFTDDDLDRARPMGALLGLKLHAEQLHRAVHRHRTERDRLIEQAISAQEGERKRIAFDLHDGVTTALASMAFHLSAADLTMSEVAASAREGRLREELAGDPSRLESLERGRAELRRARELADLAYNETRAAISGLHSLVLDDLGLVAAVESLVQAATTDDGPRLELVVEPGSGADELPEHVAAALYRMLQEALSNALRHAGASWVRVSLRRVRGSLVLGCADDGEGFDLAGQRAARTGDQDGTQHFGLSSLAERCAMIGASLLLDSQPGRGTTVLVELPVGTPDTW